MSSITRFGSFVVALFVALVVAPPTAEAQVKPWKIRGIGMADFVPLPLPDGSPNPTDYGAFGTATMFGRYTTEGTFQIIEVAEDGLSGTFSALETAFTAANGDTLVGTFGDPENGAQQLGYYDVYPAGGDYVIVVFVAELNPTPGASTGRFSDVIAGSLIMIATTEPIHVDEFDQPITWYWEGEGTLTFRKGNSGK